MRFASLLLLIPAAFAQFGPPPGRGPARPAKESAPIDLTGYWVSVVNEDWRFRMVVPPKGDYPGIPLTPEARRIADSWDPAKDEASGNQCKAYGAAALMRVPSRFHITWQDDNTLKVESDAGTQTRLFHFPLSRPAPGAPSLQGYSAAEWQLSQGGRGGRGGQGQPGALAQRGGSLKVVTTNMTSGYIRKNGVPYSDKATVTEYFDLVNEPGGEQWMIIKTILEDPQYLGGAPFVVSTNLKKQPDAKGWNPGPCTVK
jgi:hypothetical protein